MISSANFIIRPAEAGDATSLAQIRHAFRSNIGEAVESKDEFIDRCQKWMIDRLAIEGTWRCWVAVADGKLIGSVWLQLVEKLPNPVAEEEWHGYVSSLYVEPKWRGAGIGSALLVRCLDQCERRGVDAVILWPTPKSRGLYERHGFAVREDLLEKRNTPNRGGDRTRGSTE